MFARHLCNAAEETKAYRFGVGRAALFCRTHTRVCGGTGKHHLGAVANAVAELPEGLYAFTNRAGRFHNRARGEKVRNAHADVVEELPRFAHILADGRAHILARVGQRGTIVVYSYL